MLSHLLATTISDAHRQLRRAIQGATYLIDSTSLRLNALSATGARFSADLCGAKLHVAGQPWD